jgi:prepilin-type N-terminal cleavage/methylation domain-containing protein
MKSYYSNSRNIKQQGFTIIELMIATAVFAVIMLIATATVIYVSKTYVKGQVEAQTQQTARNILTTVSQDIEFNKASSVDIPAGQTTEPFFFCVGDHVYVYTLDSELIANPSAQTSPDMYSSHDLLVYTSSTCPTTAANSQPTFGTTGIQSGQSTYPYGALTQEFLSNHLRLGQLTVSCVMSGGSCTNTFTVSVIVAYGDDDLSQDPAHGGTRIAPPSQSLSPTDHYSYSCLAQTLGGSFCAVASLTTTVESRIN